MFQRQFQICSPSIVFVLIHDEFGVPRGAVVKSVWLVTQGSRFRASGFFRGSVLGQDTSEPSLVLFKPRKDMNNVSCRRDMTEIMLKAA